jgi:flagellar hook-length control protein FliK
VQAAPELDAPTPAKTPDAPITLAAAFGTDPGATAQIKTATAAYEVARAAAPILPASEQVALTIQRAIQDGIDRMTVELKPAALGRVSAEIEFHDDHRVHVVLSAERPATLDALRSDSRSLERALQEAGLRADAGSLSFRFQNGGGNNGGFASGGASASYAAASQSQPLDETPALVAQRLALLRGGIDIRV